MSDMVRTRAAISPTGFPHIGTIYQVLFDYAFAKKHQGRFIVRIEDTDQERTVAGAETKIFSALDWFGLSEDESIRKKGPYGPYRQSDRLPIYKKYAEELVGKGKAYYCFCTKQRLEELRNQLQKQKKVPMYDKYCRKLNSEEVKKRLQTGEKFVIRLKVPENITIKVRDELRGEISFDSDNVDDQVLLKSDGYPTYFLAVVVDDHLMKITHMVRGEEWLTSSPKIKLLYDHFQWDIPRLYHTPIIRNPDKSKFSKRQGHTNVDWYKENGFLPEAILNYLALLGWSHPEGKELFTLTEFIALFDLKDLKPIGPIFDLPKLEWMNGQYIMKMQRSKIKDQILNYYKKYQDLRLPEDMVEKTVPLIQERIKKLADYLPLCEFFFQPPEKYEINLSSQKELFSKIVEKLQQISDWQAEELGGAMQSLASDLKVKNSEFFMALRVAVSGKKITPPLNESMEILGKTECLRRIELTIDKTANNC